MPKQPIADPSLCPACKEPDVPVRNQTVDGLRFRRCPQCMHSWFTRVTKAGK